MKPASVHPIKWNALLAMLLLVLCGSASAVNVNTFHMQPHRGPMNSGDYFIVERNDQTAVNYVLWGDIVSGVVSANPALSSLVISGNGTPLTFAPLTLTNPVSQGSSVLQLTNTYPVYVYATVSGASEPSLNQNYHLAGVAPGGEFDMDSGEGALYTNATVLSEPYNYEIVDNIAGIAALYSSGGLNGPWHFFSSYVSGGGTWNTTVPPTSVTMHGAFTNYVTNLNASVGLSGTFSGSFSGSAAGAYGINDTNVFDAAGYGIAFTSITNGPYHSDTWSGKARLPLLAYNTWEQNNNPSDMTVRSNALGLVNSGLAAAGYNIVWLDANWVDSTHERDVNGLLIPWASTTNYFTNMPALVNYVHSLGLKFGIYTQSGNANFGPHSTPKNISSDVAQFAGWGVDYLKIDGNTTLTYLRRVWGAVKLNCAAKTPILVDSSYYPNPVDPEILAESQSWERPDSNEKFQNLGNMISSANDQEWSMPFVRPGHCGNLFYCNSQINLATLTNQMNMLVMWPSPIYIDTASNASLASYAAVWTNQEVLRINQDPAVIPHRIVFGSPGATQQIWYRPLGYDGSGKTAVLFINNTSSSATMTVNWSSIGLDPSQSATIRNPWTSTVVTTATGSYAPTVPANSTALYKIIGSALP